MGHSGQFQPGNKAAVGRRRKAASRLNDAYIAMEEALLEWEADRVIAARKKLEEESMFEMTDSELEEAIPHEGTKQAALKSFFKLILRYASFGEPTAQKLMMERIAPRGKLPHVELGNVSKLSPAEAAQQVADIMAKGGLSPDTAKACVEVFMMNAEIAHYQAETRLAQAMAEDAERINEDQA